MKLAGIIFLIATIVYFLIKWKKTGNIKPETNKTSTKKGDEKKKTDDSAGGTEYWKKNRKSLIIWVIILQFIVLNLIYPGKWFEVKKIFWFFAPRISDKYAAIKEYKDIVEADKKKKLSDIQVKIKKFEQTKDLGVDDIKKLNDLKKQAVKINNVYSETKTEKPVSAKPKEEVWNWTFKWERNDRQWEEAKKAGRKKKGEEYPARLLDITPSQLTMEYVSGYSGKPKKVALKVGNTGDFWAADYFVKSKNPKEIDLSLKVSLYKNPESPGNFTGIFWQDQDGQQVNCWLSKNNSNKL